MVISKSKTIIVSVALFIGIELLIIMGWFKGCNYSAHKVTEENIYAVRMVNPEIDIIQNTKDANSIIIRDGSNEYLLFWEGAFARAYKMNSTILVESLAHEQELFAKIKEGTNKVCFLSSETTIYLSIEEYNTYHKRQCIIGTILLSVFELIIIGVFITIVIATIR